VVISQIFGGGGNSGAPFRNDFIEIFNNGQTTVNLDGWSVQYVSATGSTWAVTNLASVSLDPGQYFLIQEGPTGSNGLELPPPDTFGSITMAATAGKVALVSSSTALSGTCPSNQTIVDLVGYGTTANCFRGTGPTPSPSNTTAVMRLANGCVDSQNNSLDFITGPPNPRNRSSMLNSCPVAWIQLNNQHLAAPLFRLLGLWSQIANLQSNYFPSDKKTHSKLCSN
jgi:predicted extracellular nuclease